MRDGLSNGRDQAVLNTTTSQQLIINSLEAMAMRLMIRIKTPKGYATSTERKLRPFILGLRRKDNHEILTSKDDDQILWIIQSGSRDYMRICKNVAMYDKIVGNVLGRKTIRRVARLSKEQEMELDDMLFNQTSVDIISRAEQEKIKKGFILK